MAASDGHSGSDDRSVARLEDLGLTTGRTVAKLTVRIPHGAGGETRLGQVIR